MSKQWTMSTAKTVRTGTRVSWVRDLDAAGRHGEEMVRLWTQTSGYGVALVIPHTLQRFSYSYTSKEEALAKVLEHLRRAVRL